MKPLEFKAIITPREHQAVAYQVESWALKGAA